MKTFQIGKAISYGWGRIKINWQVLCGSILVMYIAQYLIKIMTKQAEGDSFAAGTFGLLSFAFGIFAMLALARMGLLEGRGHKIVWKDMVVSDIVPYARMFLLGLLMGGIIVVIALLAFLSSKVIGANVAIPLGILGGLFVIVKLRLSTYAVADGLGPIAAIKASFNMTDNCFWQMAGLTLTLTILNVFGAVFFLVGLLITVPLVLIAEGHVYHTLK